MQVACSTICYKNHAWPEVLDAMAADGWRNVELVAIPGWIHIDVVQTDANTLVKEMTKRGLVLSAIHAGALMGTDRLASMCQLSYMRAAIDLLEEAGAAQLVFTGGKRANENLDDFVSALAQLAEHLDGTSVKIGLENHYNNCIETIDDYDYIFARIDHPQIGIAADFGHFNSSKVDAAELLRKHAHRINHVHVKDHVGTASVRLGAGEVDIPALLAILRGIGYQRSLSVELEVQDEENLRSYAREALEYLSNVSACVGLGLGSTPQQHT